MIQSTDPAAVRAAADSVFSDGAFDRGAVSTLWSRGLAWLGEWLNRLFDMATGNPLIGWSAVALVSVIAIVFAGRAMLLTRARGGAGLGSNAPARGRAAPAEALSRAQLAADAGRYTEAAHLLYEALLQAVAAQERVRLHPSSTVGDYVRDLRGRSSALFERFRDFARSYEYVVYGVGECDRERYERLLELAQPVVQPATRGRR